MTRLLERAGYQVVEAQDGLEALRLAIKRLPDLLILDVSMPGMDGYAVCRAIQAEAGANAPPVIFLTAHATPRLASRASTPVPSTTSSSRSSTPS